MPFKKGSCEIVFGILVTVSYCFVCLSEGLAIMSGKGKRDRKGDKQKDKDKGKIKPATRAVSASSSVHLSYVGQKVLR